MSVLAIRFVLWRRKSILIVFYLGFVVDATTDSVHIINDTGSSSAGGGGSISKDIIDLNEVAARPDALYLAKSAFSPANYVCSNVFISVRFMCTVCTILQHNQSS